MPSLGEYQAQFKTALDNAPDFLVFDGFYVYKTSGAVYDPAKDDYEGTETENVTTKFIRGTRFVEGANQITFLTGTLPFTFGKPTVNGTLVVGGEGWNIRSISRDAIGLTYTFTVENKDGI